MSEWDDRAVTKRRGPTPAEDRLFIAECVRHRLLHETPATAASALQKLIELLEGDVANGA